MGRPRRDISPEMVKNLHSQGYSFRVIARWTGVGYGTVRRAYHRPSQGGAEAGADSAPQAAPMPPERAAETGAMMSVAVFG